MTNDPTQLMALAICYQCIAAGYQNLVMIYLLDKWLTKKKGG